MQDITGALNEIVAELRTATDPMSGDLARDTGARALMRSFSALGTTVILPNAPEGSPRTLAELGLAIQRDGSFTFDSARMAELMTRDPAGVAAMFTTRIDGIYSTIERISRSSSASGDPASLAGSIDRYQSQSQQIQTDLEKLAGTAGKAARQHDRALRQGRQQRRRFEVHPDLPAIPDRRLERSEELTC